MPRASDISMRHFPPDISEASFQIPVAAHDEDLLIEDKIDELELTMYDPFGDSVRLGLDADPFATPISRTASSTARRSFVASTAQRRVAAAAVVTAVAEGERGGKAQTRTKTPTTVSAATPILPKKDSTDDMFQRRKRDSYQQMGIDLSSKSTARLRRASNENKEQQLVTKFKPPISKEPEFAHSTITANGSKPNTNTQPFKHKSKVHSTTADQSTSTPIATAPMTPSTLSHCMTESSRVAESEHLMPGDIISNNHNDVRRDSENGSKGGGFIDMLVMCGEKLKDSLGFSSSGELMASASGATFAEDSHHIMNVSAKAPDEPSNDAASSSDLKETMTLSELSSRRKTPTSLDIRHAAERRHVEMSPMRPSKKRASPGSPRVEGRKGRKIENLPSQRLEPSKQAQPDAVTSKRRALGPSRSVNGIRKSISTKDIAAPTKRRLATSRSELNVKIVEESNGNAQRSQTTDKEQHILSPTLEAAPLFASDVYRKLALEKEQEKRENMERKEKQLKASKGGTMRHSRKPAPPAVRTTVPTAFTFQCDVRAAQRIAEFEARNKASESRTTRRAVSIPDFATIHAAQTRPARPKVVPVLPTGAPTLSTMARAKEREKFEEERRAREKALEKLHETREREKAEEEERAYRAARKRTVPKAHEVPEWYKDVPKRK